MVSRRPLPVAEKRISSAFSTTAIEWDLSLLDWPEEGVCIRSRRYAGARAASTRLRGDLLADQDQDRSLSCCPAHHNVDPLGGRAACPFDRRAGIREIIVEGAVGMDVPRATITSRGSAYADLLVRFGRKWAGARDFLRHRLGEADRGVGTRSDVLLPDRPFERAAAC